MVSGNQGPWTDRIQALVEAMGWSHHTAAVKLGYRCWAPVERVLRGGRPAVGLLVRLKALEECYAGEVEAWRAGLRFRRGSPGRGWMLDWRDEPAAESTVERRGLGVEGISVGGVGAPLDALGSAAAGTAGGPRVAVAPPRIWWRKKQQYPAKQLG